MIHIEGNYYLDADTYQFIICEKKVRKDGKDAGSEYYDQIAFCGNLFQVKNWLFNQELRSNIELIKNIGKCVELSNSIDKSLTAVGKTNRNKSKQTEINRNQANRKGNEWNVLE